MRQRRWPCRSATCGRRPASGAGAVAGASGCGGCEMPLGLWRSYTHIWRGLSRGGGVGFFGCWQRGKGGGGWPRHGAGAGDALVRHRRRGEVITRRRGAPRRPRSPGQGDGQNRQAGAATFSLGFRSSSRWADARSVRRQPRRWRPRSLARPTAAADEMPHEMPVSRYRRSTRWPASGAAAHAGGDRREPRQRRGRCGARRECVYTPVPCCASCSSHTHAPGGPDLTRAHEGRLA